jgi:hypothetical protein
MYYIYILWYNYCTVFMGMHAYRCIHIYIIQCMNVHVNYNSHGWQMPRPTHIHMILVSNMLVGLIWVTQYAKNKGKIYNIY